MNVEMVIQEHNGRTFDISQLVSNIKWSTDLVSDQPGKLKFDYVEVAEIIPDYGNRIRLRINNQNLFFGRVSDKERNQNNVMSVTAKDLMWDLANEHTYVFPAMTSSQIFSRICRDKAIPYRIVNASNFNAVEKVYDNISLFDMLQDAFDQTLIAHRQWFFVRDNFGTLEHVNISSQQTSLVIGDASMATGFNFKGSISQDTFNRVRLVRENQETKRREVYVVQDSNNISRWGLRQLHETVDENLNPAQVEARATMLLRAKNRPTRELKITALGDLRVRAGNGIILSIARLEDEGFASIQRALVCSCTHEWTSIGHLMDLTLRVVN